MPFLLGDARIRKHSVGRLSDDALNLKLGAFPKSPDTLLGGLLLELSKSFGRETGFLGRLQLVEDCFEIDRSS